MDQETQRKIWREKFAAKSKESKAAKYKRLKERRKQRMASDPEYLEKTRERWRLKKQKQREAKRDQVNEYMRTRYERKKESDRPKIYNSRRKRDPTIGLATLAKDIRAGRKQPRELVLAISTAVEQLGTLIHGSQRASIPRK